MPANAAEKSQCCAVVVGKSGGSWPKGRGPWLKKTPDVLALGALWCPHAVGPPVSYTHLTLPTTPYV